MILRVPRRRNRLESLLALATLCWLVCTWPTGVAGGKHRGKSVESSALARPGTRSDSNEATASESGGGSPRSGHGVVRSIHVAEPGDASTSSSPHALLSSSTADRSWHGQLQLGPDGRPRTDHERTEIVLATAKSRVGDDVERQRRWLRRKHFLRQEYPEAYDRATKTLKHLGLPPRNDRGLYHRFSEQQYLKALDVMAEAEKLNHGDLFLASRYLRNREVGAKGDDEKRVFSYASSRLLQRMSDYKRRGAKCKENVLNWKRQALAKATASMSAGDTSNNHPAQTQHGTSQWSPAIAHLSNQHESSSRQSPVESPEPVLTAARPATPQLGLPKVGISAPSHLAPHHEIAGHPEAATQHWRTSADQSPPHHRAVAEFEAAPAVAWPVPPTHHHPGVFASASTAHIPLGFHHEGLGSPSIPWSPPRAHIAQDATGPPTFAASSPPRPHVHPEPMPSPTTTSHGVGAFSPTHPWYEGEDPGRKEDLDALLDVFHSPRRP